MKLLLVFLLAAPAFAQVTFEAATIDPIEMTLGQALGGRSSVTIDDSFATFRGQSHVQLIQRAYGVMADQIIKLPDSVRGANFDIRAKIPAGVSKDKVPEMLQALLVERFKLAVHRQEEQRKLYELTVAPGGTKKMQRVEGAGSAAGPGKCPFQSGHRMCQAMTMAELATMMTNLRTLAMAAAKAPAAAAAGLAEMAANAPVDFLVDRPVVDNTGLDGRFAFPFDYGPVPGSPDTPPVRIVDSLTALGLKLVPVTRPVQTVVIDHIERMPTGN